MGKQLGRTLPICLANLIVFLIVGIWHGAAWKFIAYGLYNGGIIALSGLLAPSFRKWKKSLHIQEKSGGWVLFQILRTFLLVNISWFFDRADTIPQALRMMGNALTQCKPSQILSIPIGLGGTDDYTSLFLGILLAGTLILFLVSLFQERGKDVFRILMAKPVWVRAAVYLALLFVLPGVGASPVSTGGFIYAQF